MVDQPSRGIENTGGLKENFKGYSCLPPTRG